MTKTGSLPSFPMERGCPLDPPPGYTEARQQPGLQRVKLWNGNTGWLATRHDDVRSILSDPRFSAMPSKPGYPFVSEALGSLLLYEKPTFVSMDGQEHSRYRRMLAPMFAIKRIEALRPRIQQIVDETIDHLLKKGPPLDFFEEFALVIPSLAISELLGVPYEDHKFFQDVARARMDLSAGPEVPLKAGEQMAEYLDKLLRKKESSDDPGQDLLGRLIVDHIRPGRLDRDDAIAIGRLLLVAGHETTANVIAMGTLLLLEHPDQLAATRKDDAMVNRAVEEILRYMTVPHFNSLRVAIEDVNIRGQVIKAGEGVLAMVSGANRDPAVFEEPDKFNIFRDASHHVTFADGIHQCLGQPLARLELQIVFKTLFDRIPTLKVAEPMEKLTFKHDQRAYGVYSLPVTW